MRISITENQFISNYFCLHYPSAQVFLFGSRVDDYQKGGDIDLLVLNVFPLSIKEKINFIGDFIEEFGEQKIDLVSFAYSEDTPFKNIALQKAIQL